MRRNLTALLLTVGVVAGFGSGIMSCSRGGHGRYAGREGCDGPGSAGHPHPGRAAAVAKDAAKAATPPAATTTTTPAAPAEAAPVPAAPEG